MSVQLKTWTYGTRKSIKVLFTDLRGPFRFVAGVDQADPEEAYLVVQVAELPAPEVDDVVDIVFTAGALTGGYWRFD